MGKSDFFHLLPKNIFLRNYVWIFQLRMIFTDFLHAFTFLKLVGSCGKIFFGKSYFFPKILNFFCIGLPPAETYWMIMSPLKRVKKNPNNLYLQNIHILCKLTKNEFWSHFQNSVQGQKNFKNYYGPIDLQNPP